ncbi:hypothetical protein MMC34_003815 [Xylographa carneopallida]|nr:hypothetical protein [Xylographa carneopallida]
MLLPLGSPGTARRAKAHVPSACVNCKRKHLACETRRPCNRCLQAGKEATCVDVQHKKRGRPRLRDEEQGRGVHYGSENTLAHLHPAQSETPILQGSDPAAQPRNLTYREIRSQPESFYGNSQPPQFVNPSNPGHPSYQDALPPNHSIPQTSPVALLTLDFVVLRSNYAFSDALSLGYNFQGRSLRELLIASDRDKLQRLQNSFRAELHDSAHLPPVRPPIPGGVFDILSSTSGFQQRPEYWTFHLPDGQSRGFPISVSLARTTTYFLVLTLVAHAKPAFATMLPISHGGWNPPVTSLSSLSLQPSMPYPPGAQLPPNGPEITAYRRQSVSSQTGSGYSPPSSSVSGRTARSSMQSPDLARASLKLPPIRTSGIAECPRRDAKTGSAKGSPQSAKRMKRRRVEIGEICGK